MDYLLKMVNSPEDLRKIPIRKLPMLCHEIREKIISAVSDNGGHLASNLGVVDLRLHFIVYLMCPMTRLSGM